MDLGKLLEKLGLDSPKWKWRLYRWEQRREKRRGERGGRAAVPVLCAQCRAVLSGERTCPYCGARAPSARVRYVQRRIGLIVPAWFMISGLLLVANVGVMLAMMVLHGPSQLFKPDPVALFAMGSLVPRAVEAGEWWRVVTYGYLHIGLIHIAFNLFALSQVGPFLEQQIGGARFFVVYSLALAGGAAADLLVRGGQVITIAGASGALFGLIGFGVTYAHCYGGAQGRTLRNFFLQWALYGFVFGMVVGADNVAHAGGFLAGAAMGFLVERERRLPFSLTPFYRAAAVLCLLVTIGAFVANFMAG